MTNEVDTNLQNLNFNNSSPDSKFNDNKPKKFGQVHSSKMNQIIETNAQDIMKSTLDLIKNDQKNSDDKLYRCILCTFTNRLLCKIKGHLQARHDQFKKFYCEICKKKFSVSTHFEEHSSLHLGVKPFECKICSKTFMYSKDFNSHVNQVHVSGNFECKHCEEKFKTKADHSCHAKKHGRKTYLCEECGKELSALDKLKIHMRIHTGDKPYNCHFCGKKFPNSTRLKEHENIHNKIKPSKCNICGRCFSQRTPLKHHIMRVHSGESPFKCSDCGKGFVGNIFLNAHKKTCGKNKKVVKKAKKQPLRNHKKQLKETSTDEIHDFSEANVEDEKGELPTMTQPTQNSCTQENDVENQNKNNDQAPEDLQNENNEAIPHEEKTEVLSFLEDFLNEQNCSDLIHDNFQQLETQENLFSDDALIDDLTNQQEIGQNFIGDHQVNPENSTNNLNSYLPDNQVNYSVPEYICSELPSELCLEPLLPKLAWFEPRKLSID